jgi:hypothetical protein
MNDSNVLPGQRHRAAATGQVLAGLMLGAGLWLLLDLGRRESVQHWIALGIAAAICLIPQVRQLTISLIDRLRTATPRSITLITLGVFAGVFLYLLTAALWQDRDLYPDWHDQQMTLIQAQMLARGRLWMPQHPCADFFETFYVFVKPVYAAMYFPGAALFFVPGVWLHLPEYILPLIASSLVAVMLFRIVSELADPAAGLLAVIILVSLWIFRLLSLWSMSHMVFTLLALWAVWSWMKWRRAGSIPWAISLGTMLGWMAITRPVDAISYGLVIGIAVLLTLRKLPARRGVASILLCILATIPFLSLQLILDKGITGQWLKSPLQYYDDVEMPGIKAFGVDSTHDVTLTSHLPQKQLQERAILAMRREFSKKSRIVVLGERVESLLKFTLPTARSDATSLGAGLLLILLPVGLFSIRDPRAIVLVAPIIPFIIGYAFYSEMLDHYCIAVAPGIIYLLVLGVRSVERAWPRERAFVGSSIPLAVIALSIASLPELHRDTSLPVEDRRHTFDDDSFAATGFNYETLPDKVEKPALVLYRYWNLKPGEQRNFSDEPVYNVDVADIDKAPIIRAHDLGDRDREIIDYYAKIQPDRHVYIVDRENLQIQSLGTAGDIAKRIASHQ